MKNHNQKGPLSGIAILIGAALLLLAFCPSKFLLILTALALITWGIYMFTR